MQEIIIDGVNLNEMKAKHDVLQAEMAEARSKIRQGASKFIADNIKQGKQLIDSILVESDDDEPLSYEQIDSAAKQAYNLLNAARFVSQVADVAFDLPYYDRQCDYYPDGTPYTNQIDDCENELVVDSEAVTKLYSLLESMESDVSDWNTSFC